MQRWMSLVCLEQSSWQEVTQIGGVSLQEPSKSGRCGRPEKSSVGYWAHTDRSAWYKNNVGVKTGSREQEGSKDVGRTELRHRIPGLRLEYLRYPSLTLSLLCPPPLPLSFSSSSYFPLIYNLSLFISFNIILCKAFLPLVKGPLPMQE